MRRLFRAASALGAPALPAAKIVPANGTTAGLQSLANPQGAKKVNGGQHGSNGTYAHELDANLDPPTRRSRQLTPAQKAHLPHAEFSKFDVFRVWFTGFRLSPAKPNGVA